MRVTYRGTAEDDIIRQFRYFLVTLERPDVALRFREAVRLAVRKLQGHPFLGARYPLRNPGLQDLRSWPVAGFETIRIYYLVGDEGLRVIRFLDGRRNVRRILENEWADSL